jgi:thioredoxin-like negative regulator of GroEL
MLPTLDQFDFHHRVTQLAGPTLVMFSSPDCGACRHLRRELLDVRARRPAWWLFEIDAQRDAALTREFEVFHLPALFLFSDGEFHRPLHAEARAQAIIDATESALAAPAEEAP